MKLLEFDKTKSLLKKYNIHIKNTEIFNNKNEAANYAKKIGFPVVLKVYSRHVIHKTEENAIIINIKDESELQKQFLLLDYRFEDEEGIIIQKQFKGRELVVGLNYDQTFGPIIMIGLGGIFVEVLNDVSFRACPLTKKDALEMIKELKGFKILTNFRGKKKVDIDKLAQFLINLSELGLKEKDVISIDFNPIFINENEIHVADFRIIVKENA